MKIKNGFKMYFELIRVIAKINIQVKTTAMDPKKGMLAIDAG
jgi:hypothetical protein